MKFLKNFLIGFVLFFAILIASLYIFKVDYLITAVRKIYFNGHTTAFLDDYTEFENRTIPKSNTPQPWPIATTYNAVKPTAELEKWHEKMGTVAFVIIKEIIVVLNALSPSHVSVCQCKGMT